MMRNLTWQNRSSVSEFILLGFSSQPGMQLLLFAVFLAIYLANLFGNSLIFVLIRIDSHLHMPMYFFLANLSFLDISYTTTTVPQMLLHLLSKKKNISYIGCITQMYIFLSLGITECILYAVMAYDRYVAICHPLHYTLIMSRSICVKMAASSWVGGFFFAMVHTGVAMRLPYCGPNEINHFFCEVPAILKLAFADTRVTETMLNGNQSSLSEFILLGVSDRPQLELMLFVLILISYTMTLLGNTTIIVVSWLDPHLHTPMYFFLSNLSFLDLCYTTSVGPQMLLNFQSTHKSISWAGCVAQLYISLSLGSTECLLLAIMAYDRYAAICQPLHYMAIMSHRFCLQLAATAWLCGFGNSILQTILILRLPRCERNQIDNLFCEVPALLKLACVDTSATEAEILAGVVFFLLVPLGFILISYSYIGAAVLKIRSAKGRLKAFNTCTSHLAVVSLFYGTAISIYLQPPSSYSRHREKIVSLFYTMVTPMLNPLIYTLRNKEVHRALQRALRRNMTVQGV
ncbi:putative olfactory receptor 2B8 [Mauremys mutica]|uniref:putative olfactory receptor 2B8 n=1 Tax=Mauremys mutica TaxID=74926 RepID=UPI001D16DA05|nr:putative olfactory receptor 2B8 [Mauremys mutica]